MIGRLASLVLIGSMFLATQVRATATTSPSDGGAAQLLRNIHYRYDVEPHQVGDPQHDKLLDGKPDPVIWNPPPPRRSTATIDFDLQGTHHITRVEVDAYRGAAAASRIRSMQLCGDGGAGWELADKMQELAGADYYMHPQATAAPGLPPLALISEEPVTFVFDDLDRRFAALRLILEDAYQPGPNFGITEVRIYGTPLSQEEGAAAASPQEQAAALKPYTLPAAKAELTFSEGNYDSDPEKELLLANRWVTMVIEPSLGGVIGSFRYGGVEFTQPKNPHAPGGGGGLLSDHVVSQPLDGDWFNAPYQYKLVEQSPDRISVQLSCTGRSGSLQYLTFNKTITMWRDRSQVQVDYSIGLDQKATVPLPFTFWFHNYLGTRDAAGRKDPAATFFIPEEQGIRALNWAGNPATDAWFTHLSRGWIAFADAQRKVGLAFNLDYRHLASVHSWASKGHNGLPTLEWRFGEVAVPHNGSFKTTITLTPFRGASEVSGAGPRMAGAVRFEPPADSVSGKVVATIISAENTQGVAILRHRLLPTGEWQTLSRTEVNLKVDEPLTISCEYKPDAEGTHVFSAVVTRDGEELLDMEKPFSIGPPRQDYALRPNVKRVAAGSDTINLQYRSMDYQTPHVKWARPYHLGKTKALVLLDGRYQREIIELAQRMDLDFDTTYLFPTDVGEALSDYYGKTNKVDQARGLQRLLSDNPDWQVLVMAGDMFRYFSPEQRRLVVERVRNGAGLVVAQPDGTDPLPELGALHPAKPGFARSTWQKSKDHFITTGIPWAALPATDVGLYSADKEAEVLAAAGSLPLVAARGFGKGRIVSLAYRAGDANDGNGRIGDFWGLTPFMTGPDAEDLVPLPTFNYYEYHFSLLARAVLWAARREPELSIARIEAAPEKLTLALDNRASAQPLSIEMAVCDKYGTSIPHRGPVQHEVAAGSSIVELAIPPDLPNGTNLIDVFIRDAQGRIVNWASACLPVDHGMKIAEVRDDKEIYHPGDTVSLTVRLDGADARKGLSLIVKAWDGFGRLTVRKAVPVSSPRVSAQFAVRHPLNMLMTIETALLGEDGKPIDVYRMQRPVELPLPAGPHRGEMTLLGWNMVSIYGLNNYLLPSYFRLLSEIGFNAGLIMARDNTPTYREALWRNNMIIQTRGPDISYYSTQLGNDPEHPVRNPCLRDPSWLSAQVQSARGSVSTANTFAVQAGDEFPFAQDPQDLCFAPHYLAAMRQWLQTEYPSLEALNTQWGTSFGNWNEVTPLTLKETRQRGDNNYSSWCDHRAFGEMTVADFFGRLGQVVASQKPGAYYGPSGNPSVGTWGGYDFWQLHKCLTGLWGYSGSDELSLWSRDRTKVLEYCGFQGPEITRADVFSKLFLGMSGIAVCGTQRVPAFDWTDSRAARGYRQVWAPLRHGIGRLLNESTRTPDPIAVHYSRNASRLAEALGQRGLWHDNRTYLRFIFSSCGLDFGWISYEQLENGQTEGLKAIYLPMSFTLSDKEAAALRTFVEQGGVLIGQLGIGIADGHGKMLPEGRLDDVFGIARRKSQTVARNDLAVRKQVVDGLAFPEMPLNYLEVGLEAKGAAVLATGKENAVPVAFANKYGKGTAIYIACDLPTSYFTLNAARGLGANPKYTAEAEDFLEAVMARAGVHRRVKLTSADGARVPFTSTVLFAQGQIRYYGILRDYSTAKDFASAPAAITIQFPEKGYVRELFSDTDYGLTDRVQTLIAPTSLFLYSWTPYRTEKLDLALAPQDAGEERPISCTIALRCSAAPGTHTLRLTVLDPDGSESEPYSCNLTAEGGAAHKLIPLALNDKKGRWTVQVKDLTSGQTAEATFTNQ